MRDERKSRNDPGVAQEWVDADSDEVMDAGAVVTYMAGPRGVECRIHYDTQQEKDVFRWYIYDGLGSVLSEVDDEGNVTRATSKYDVYGAAVTQYGSTDSKHRFVGSIGHQVEPSTGGLIYMRARWYDPATGRFISEDPAANGNNWYAYCDGNPVNRFDQNGQSWQAVGAIFLILLFLYFVYVVNPELEHEGEGQEGEPYEMPRPVGPGPLEPAAPGSPLPSGALSRIMPSVDSVFGRCAEAIMGHLSEIAYWLVACGG